jgi:GT2 family glycosyltransferase
MREPYVYIIILNWNQADDTIRCLDSLRTLAYKNFSVIVVDNGSRDGSPAKIKKEFPDIRVIANKHNLGFAAGNNVGINYALKEEPDYIFLLNNDTKVEPSLMRELITVAESDTRIGVVGAVNYSFNEPDKVTLVHTTFNWLTGFTKREPLEAIANGHIVEPQEAHGVCGSSLLIKRGVIETVGLLDERFFIYYEDTDWCLRAGKAGFQVL